LAWRRELTRSGRTPGRQGGPSSHLSTASN